MKLIKLLLISGWFFAFQHDYKEQAQVKGIVGPFGTEKVCEEERLALITSLEQLNVKGAVGKCVFRQEA
jgi:hypothetical protein